jgi:hypothetical protein
MPQDLPSGNHVMTNHSRCLQPAHCMPMALLMIMAVVAGEQHFLLPRVTHMVLGRQVTPVCPGIVKGSPEMTDNVALTPTFGPWSRVARVRQHGVQPTAMRPTSCCPRWRLGLAKSARAAQAAHPWEAGPAADHAQPDKRHDADSADLHGERR